jgi:hypothetical protein
LGASYVFSSLSPALWPVESPHHDFLRGPGVLIMNFTFRARLVPSLLGGGGFLCVRDVTVEEHCFPGRDAR